jgi:hypothetical protein
MTFHRQATMIGNRTVMHMKSNTARFGPLGLRCSPSTPCRLPPLGAVIFVCGALTATVAAEPPVTIAGGARPDNPHFYEWVVTNASTSPIVFIEFPQYRGDTFTAPPEWSQEWKNRASIGGGKNAPGWVRTSVEHPAEGIAAGESAQFELRVSRAGALARLGEVTVRFADGTEVVVADVELPSAQSLLERNAMVIGLVVIIAIALLIHFRRRAKPATTPASAPPTTDDEDGPPNT